MQAALACALVLGCKHDESATVRPTVEAAAAKPSEPPGSLVFAFRRDPARLPTVLRLDLQSGEYRLRGECDETCREDLVDKILLRGHDTLSRRDLDKLRPHVMPLLAVAAQKCTPVRDAKLDERVVTFSPPADADVFYYVAADDAYRYHCSRQALAGTKAELEWLVRWLLMNTLMSQP